MAAATNHHKLCGLRQCNFIILYFWWSCIRDELVGLCLFWRLRERIHSLPCPTLKGHLSVPWLVAQHHSDLCSAVTSPSLTLLPASLPYKDCCDDIDSTRCPRWPPQLRTLNLITPAMSLLSHRDTTCRFWGLGHRCLWMPTTLWTGNLTSLSMFPYL